MTRRAGRPWRRQVEACHLTYGTVCHLCRHGGADSADHLLAVEFGGTNDLANLRPAHHKACPVCGLRCNAVRGSRPLTPELLATFRRSEPVDGRAFFSQAAAGHPAPSVRPSPERPRKNLSDLEGRRS
ncbi:hypothetical protein [Cellulosimicrobium sp. I38E]|uniref:hypothetical protein n=1 Tax=Cellulosimicrobium sp. I38E TaxID=1393139 RepID=UPI000AB59877|nr:hypothetical protein [Cellulosimicrobium sp. I38E]